MLKDHFKSLLFVEIMIIPTSLLFLPLASTTLPSSAINFPPPTSHFPPHSTSSCPANWIQFNTSCFLQTSLPSPLNWGDAEYRCQENHPLASLPSILSEEEEDFLGLLTTNSSSFWLGGSRELWSDYSDSASWTWTTGSTVNFTSWGEGQPNNYLGLGERCIRYLDSGWDDHRCGVEDAFTLVCKLDIMDCGRKAGEGGPRGLYHDQTVAVVTYNGENMESCRLILAETLDTKVKVLKEMSLQMPVDQQDFIQILAIVNKCQEIQKEPSPSRPPSNYWDLAYGALGNNGVLPGTLWCGKDDIAKTYFSLGPQWRLDKCCRAHDHCPVKVKNIAFEAFKPRYGITNNGLTTKSHCDCDNEFYDCLKRLESEWGDVVGDVFFNALAMECLQNNGTDYQIVQTKKKY